MRHALGPLAVWICWLATAPALAQDPVTPDALRREINSYHENEQFDAAMARLEEILGSTPDDAPTVELRRTAYLLGIETLVLYGQSEDSQGRVKPAQGLYVQAREWARTCLRDDVLRDTTPPETYALSARDLFNETVAEMFGTFQVSRLEPEGATVYLGGALLQAQPDTGLPGKSRVPVGTVSVLVRAEGHDDHVEDVVIPAGSIVDRSFVLEKSRTWKWWVLRGTGVAALTGLVFALGSGSSDAPQDSPQPLPGPPDPPSQ